MIQIKEFLDYREGMEIKVNEWLKEREGKIKIVDIKYSTTALPPDIEYGWYTELSNSCLIIYKTIANKEATKDTDQSSPR